MFTHKMGSIKFSMPNQPNYYEDWHVTRAKFLVLNSMEINEKINSQIYYALPAYWII